jgi:hypothetical protein
MKMLTALLVAVALLSPAYAQKVTFQGTHPRPAVAMVAPATKPLLLHTGKPITPDQKRQLLATAIQQYAAGKRTTRDNAKTNNAAPPANPTVLTFDMMNKDGVGGAIANFPQSVNFPAGYLLFQPGASSNLTIFVDMQPNTAYVLLIKLWFLSTAQNPQLTLSPAFGGATPPQTFAASPGNNEFAYSFISSGTGQTAIAMSSPNSAWSFISCEISSLPAQ